MFWSSNLNQSNQSSRRSEQPLHLACSKANADLTYQESKSKSRRCPSRSAVRSTLKNASSLANPEASGTRIKLPRQTLHKKLARLVNPYEKPEDLLSHGLKSLHSSSPQEESGRHCSKHHQTKITHTASGFRNNNSKRSPVKYSLQLPVSVTSFFPPKGYQFAGPSNRYCWQKGCTEDRPLGKGFTSTVYRGLDLVTGESVAIKLVPKQKQRRLATDNYYRRLYHRLPLFPHPCLLRFRAFLEDAFFFYVITDLCRGLDLVEYTLQFYPGTIPIDVVRNIVVQILLGIQHLHQNHIIHRDIKLDNILFTDTTHQQIVIVDFDMGMMLDNPQPPRPVRGSADIFVVGTTDYMAPEAYGGVYSEATDLWGFGVILYILLEGHFPFNISYLADPKDVLNALKRKLHISPNLEKRLPLAVDLIQKLLCFDIQKRITSTDAVLRHPWISQKDVTVDSPPPTLVGHVEIAENYSSMTTVSTAPTKANHLLSKQKNASKKEISDKNFLEGMAMTTKNELNSKEAIDNSSSSNLMKEHKATLNTDVLSCTKTDFNCNNNHISSNNMSPNVTDSQNYNVAMNERVQFDVNRSVYKPTVKLPSSASSVTSGTLTPVLKPAIIHHPIVTTATPLNKTKDLITSPFITKKATDLTSQQNSLESQSNKNVSLWNNESKNTNSSNSRTNEFLLTARSKTANSVVTSSRVRNYPVSYEDRIAPMEENKLPSSRVVSPQKNNPETPCFSMHAEKLLQKLDSLPSKMRAKNLCSVSEKRVNKTDNEFSSFINECQKYPLDSSTTETKKSFINTSTINKVSSRLEPNSENKILSQKTTLHQPRTQSVATTKSEYNKSLNSLISSKQKINIDMRSPLVNCISSNSVRSVSEVIASMKLLHAGNSTTSSTASSSIIQYSPIVPLQEQNCMTEIRGNALSDDKTKLLVSPNLLDQNHFELYKPAEKFESTNNSYRCNTREQTENIINLDSSRMTVTPGGSLLSPSTKQRFKSCITNSSGASFEQGRKSSLLSTEKTFSSSSSLTKHSAVADENKKKSNGRTVNGQSSPTESFIKHQLIFVQNKPEEQNKKVEQNKKLETEFLMTKQPMLIDYPIQKKENEERRQDKERDNKRWPKKHNETNYHETLFVKQTSFMRPLIPTLALPNSKRNIKETIMPSIQTDSSIFLRAKNASLPITSLLKSQRRSQSMSNVNVIPTQKKDIAPKDNLEFESTKTIINSTMISSPILHRSNVLMSRGGSLCREKYDRNNNHQQHNRRLKFSELCKSAEKKNGVESKNDSDEPVLLKPADVNDIFKFEEEKKKVDEFSTRTSQTLDTKTNIGLSKRLENQDFLLKEKLATKKNFLAPRFMTLKNIIATRAVHNNTEQLNLNDSKRSIPSPSLVHLSKQQMLPSQAKSTAVKPTIQDNSVTPINMGSKTARSMSLKAPGYLWSLLSKPHVMTSEQSLKRK